MDKLKNMSKLQIYFTAVLILSIVTQSWVWGVCALIVLAMEETFKLLNKKNEVEMKEAEDTTRIMVQEVHDKIDKVQAMLMSKIEEVTEKQTDIIDNVRGLQRKVKDRNDDII